MNYPDYSIGGVICHHGIQGQKWGKRNGPPYPLSSDISTGSKLKEKSEIKLEKKDRSYNLNKFQKDKHHNVVYITGLSGSGKGYIAKQISKDRKCEIIELDNYIMRTEKDGDDYFTKINKDFDEFLKKEVPGFDYALRGKDRILAFDQVVKATKKYSETLYPNKGLVVEGIQLYDPDLFGSEKARNKFFDDTAIIFKGTDPKRSERRAIKRTITEYKDIPEAIKMVKDYLINKGDTRLNYAKEQYKDLEKLYQRVKNLQI